MTTAEVVTRPSIPFVNKQNQAAPASAPADNGRAPKRARVAQEEGAVMKREGETKTWTFTELPWGVLIPDNENAFYVKAYNIFKIPVLMPGNVPAKVAIRTKLL